MNILKKTNIQITTIAILLFSLVGITSCEQENWMDWKLENQLWLENNKNEPGVVTTPSGLQYKIIANPNPDGKRVDITSGVRVIYEGKFIHNGKFDSDTISTFDSGTYQAALYESILGWQEGITKMREHGTAMLYIPYDLAYGDKERGSEGNKGFIPPYSTLVFKVHLDAVLY